MSEARSSLELLSPHSDLTRDGQCRSDAVYKPRLPPEMELTARRDVLRANGSRALVIVMKGVPLKICAQSSVFS